MTPEIVKVEGKWYFFQTTRTHNNMLSVILTASSKYDHDDSVQKTFDLIEVPF